MSLHSHFSTGVQVCQGPNEEKQVSSEERLEGRGGVERCGLGSRLLYKPDEGRAVAFPYRCGRWDCLACAPEQALGWTRNILEKAPQGLFYISGPAEEMDRFFQRHYRDWNRKGIRNIRINYNGGKTLLLTTKHIPPDEKLLQVISPFEGGHGFVKGSTLASLLGEVLTLEDRPLNGRHKIRTSRMFAMKRESKGWISLHVAESPEEVSNKLVEWGSELKRKDGQRYFLKVSELAITKILELTSDDPGFIYDNLTPMPKRKRKTV